MNLEGNTSTSNKLQEELEALRAKVLHLQATTEELQNTVNTLEAELRKRDEVCWEEPFYWTKSAQGKVDGPFCQRCYDLSGKLMRLHHGLLRYRCIECGHNYQTEKQKSAQRAAYSINARNSRLLNGQNLNHKVSTSR